MQIQTNLNYPVAVSKKLVEILQKHLNEADKNLAEGDMVTISFRDPDYSAEKGGYHPVEVGILDSGRIQYITDFAYFGCVPFCELAKCMDFDFAWGKYQDPYTYQDITAAKGLYRTFQANFCGYYDMGIYQVTVS